ncbi:MAG TPA: hypothetical protein VK525_22325 [Candidatus Saccharimonadales bacterium]|nr:hypothetical protein [Candidatus Saccharimonadales bacterium]
MHTKFAWNTLALRLVFAGLGLLMVAAAIVAQDPVVPAQLATEDLDREIRQFFMREIPAHVGDIKSLDPPPRRVVGALTTGEFSWGTFMRALAAYANFTGTPMVAGRDAASLIGQMGLIEERSGGKTWAQLYAALALWSFGTDLKTNALWQGLSPQEREAWHSLLDPGRFYDLKTRKLIHLPENYFGVAARIAAISYRLGLNTDRGYVDDLLVRATEQFRNGALFADDALPTGRYDRYSNEYVRAVYEAAALVGRKDILDILAPSLTQQMRLWWNLLAPDGYGYPWGRSLGAIGYMDTMEIAAFLGENPQFRPAPLEQLAAAYYNAWKWLRNDYQDDTHLLSVFAFGRGDYSYISKEREWQQTTAFFGKVMNAHQVFSRALAREKMASFPAKMSLARVEQFVKFREGPGRQFAVWVVRQGSMQFAIPFVTGPRSGTSDYQPAPHGLPGLRFPVERIYPCLVPFLELDDKRIVAAADGADEINPSADGQSVTAVWRKWVVVGGRAGAHVDLGLTSEVTWSLAGSKLRRTETLTALKPIKVRRLWMSVPSSADHVQTIFSNGTRTDRLSSQGATLDIAVLHSDWPLQLSAMATGNDAAGRGAQGAVPLHFILEGKDVNLLPQAPQKWEIELSLILE